MSPFIKTLTARPPSIWPAFYDGGQKCDHTVERSRDEQRRIPWCDDCMTEAFTMAMRQAWIEGNRAADGAECPYDSDRYGLSVPTEEERNAPMHLVSVRESLEEVKKELGL